jgi:uncharacterized protein
MLYRRFGRTELQMPVFSCGGMRYQYKWQDLPLEQVPTESQANLEATIRRSLELGINHIETARGYGSSEMQLGQILPKLPRDQMIVQTKVAPCHKGRGFRDEFDKSLDYLGLDYVDLFALHGVNNAETLHQSIGKNLLWKNCLTQAKQLKKEGKVRHIGLSTHAPTDLIIAAIETGEFDYINLHWYYINQANWRAIEAATQQDMGVFIISPSNKGGLLYEPSQKLRELCAPLSPLVFNNLFCLSHPQVHTLSIGAAQPSDFDEHLQALDLLERADELLPPIIARLEQALVDALGETWVKTWQQGLPKVEDTPGSINIPVILWLRNLAIAYDMVAYGKMRYNLLGNGGHWFPGQRAEHVDAVAIAPALQASPHRSQIPQLLQEAHALLGGEAVKRLSQE